MSWVFPHWGVANFLPLKSASVVKLREGWATNNAPPLDAPAITRRTSGATESPFRVGRGPCVKCLRLDREIDSQRLVEGTLIRARGDAIEGLCVGHVWEETEAQREGRGSRPQVAEQDGPGKQDRCDGHRGEGEVRAEMSHEAVK